MLMLSFAPVISHLTREFDLDIVIFIKCFLSFASGEFGVYLPDHIHIGVLSEDSGVWVCVPRRSLFKELLEHIGLCHRLHGVR